MTVIEGYVRFDTLGELPYDDMGYIRFDRNCTPGKTIPCGNACRTPANCKAKNKAGKGNKARVSEKGAELRRAFAAKVREQKGMEPRNSAMARKKVQKSYAESVLNNKSPNRFGEASASEAALVESYMSGKTQPSKATKKTGTRRTSKKEQAQFGTASKAEGALVDKYMKKRGKTYA